MDDLDQLPVYVGQSPAKPTMSRSGRLIKRRPEYIEYVSQSHIEKDEELLSSLPQGQIIKVGGVYQNYKILKCKSFQNMISAELQTLNYLLLAG